GGAWMRAENRELIAAHGLSVWLNCDLDTLWHRVRQRSNRPLLQTADPKGTLAALLEKRNPVYALAEMNFPARQGDTIETATSRLIAAIRATEPELLEAR
ncbi:shikimate kinase, partial [Paracoccus siganidrum]